MTRKEYNRDYKEKHTLPFYIVYCLPNEEVPYCGKTNQPKIRMAKHKRDTSDWFILGVCKTEDEAMSLERSYHDKGYGGINKWQGMKNKGEGFVYFLESKNSWIAAIQIDGKRKQIKQSSISKQVCIDALEEFKKK